MHARFAPTAYHELDRLDPTQTILTKPPTSRVKGPSCHFIYLNIDEVMDKVPKYPTTLTNTHKHNINHQTSDD
jgi:hypothetical protein